MVISKTIRGVQISRFGLLGHCRRDRLRYNRAVTSLIMKSTNSVPGLSVRQGMEQWRFPDQGGQLALGVNLFDYNKLKDGGSNGMNAVGVASTYSPN